MLFDADVSRSDYDYAEVYPQSRAYFEDLDSLCAGGYRFGSPAAVRFPSVGIFRFRNGSICFSSGTVLDSRGLVVSETSWFSDSKRGLRVPMNPYKIPEECLGGGSLSLASEYANINYGHFLLDGLGRLSIFSKNRDDLLESCDRVLVSGPESGWKKRLLQRFGVPLEKVYWLDGRVRYRCEELVVSSFPGARRTYPSWLCTFLKNIAEEDCLDRSQRRRLFICRKGTTRKLTNEQELLELAQKFGFEKYYPEDSLNAINDFRGADAIIGSHGAGLSDIVFMDPGAKVLELMPHDHRHCYFYTLGRSSGLDYSIIVGQSEGYRGGAPWGPSPFDFSVPTAEFNLYLNREFG